MLYGIMSKKRGTMTDILRKAAAADKRSILALANDAGVSYSILYRFLIGNKTGHKQGVTLLTADKLAKALNLELRPKKRGR